MDVFLSINNREEVLQLPVVPSGFKVNNPHKNNTYETISQGDIKLIGLEGLKSLSIASFFPMKDYYFLRDRTYKGWEYVEMIERWKKRRIPIRLIITETPINWAVSLEGFTYSVDDGTGDLKFNMDFEFFPFIRW